MAWDCQLRSASAASIVGAEVQEYNFAVHCSGYGRGAPTIIPSLLRFEGIHTANFSFVL